MAAAVSCFVRTLLRLSQVRQRNHNELAALLPLQHRITQILKQHYSRLVDLYLLGVACDGILQQLSQ